MLGFLAASAAGAYFFVSCCSAASCSSDLEYSETKFVEESQSFSLRMCCNVTRLWFGQVADDDRLVPVEGLQWRPMENLTTPGFDVVVSKCKGTDSYVVGEVVNGDCIKQRGNIVTLSKDQLPEFDRWYVACFERSPKCRVCNLNKFCTPHGKCKETFLEREIVNASLTSVTILLHVGVVPFNVTLRMEIKSANSTSHYENTSEAPKNRSLKYEVSNLRLNTWYHISTCAEIRIPASVRAKYPGIPLPDRQEFCLPVEGYRTSRSIVDDRKSGRLKNTANGSSIGYFIYLNLLFCILCARST